MSTRLSTNNVIGRVIGAGNKLISLLTALMAATLILYSGYVLYDNMYIQNNAFSSGWDLLEYRPEIIDDGNTPLSGSTLAALNEDYRAWLSLYDTNIDYPVMQGEDDLYYASHDIYKENSLTGAIYLAAANASDFSDNYNMIFGHHMDNAAMFGGLDNYTEPTYFEGHREGILVTPDQVYDLNVYAVIKTDAYESNVYSVGGDRDISALNAYLKSIAVQYDETSADAAAAGLNGATGVIALSTCESAETNGRLVVFAVMTPRDLGQTGTTGTNNDGTAVTPGGTDNGATGGTTSGTAGETGNGITGSAGGTGLAAATDDGLTEIDDESTPLAKYKKTFRPTGSTYGDDSWALVNLICLIITIYILFPVLHLKAKNSRGKLLHKMEFEDEEDSFKKRMRTGVILEAVISIAALIVFILTENMRQPMVLIDEWTIVMILLMAACWLADVMLVRYRGETEHEEEPAASAA